MEELLSLLSHNSAQYRKVHASILSAFLVPWVADNAFTEIEFGSTRQPFDSVFPNIENPSEHGYFKNLKMTPDYGKLAAVNYKCAENKGALCGIGLEFSNGIKTGFFETFESQHGEHKMQ